MKQINILIIIFFLFPFFLRAQSGSQVQVNGYSSFEFEKQFGDEGKGDPNGSFDADLFDVVLNFRATDRLRVSADLTWEHGAASEDARGNVAIEYAFGEYAIDNWFKVRAGKMFTHFGIYNEIHTAKPATMTVKEPLSTNKNNKFGSSERFYPRWLTGIAVLGDFDIGSIEADYIVQLSNGDQEITNPYEEDNNGDKAFSGRFRFWPNYDLQLGFSFYSDQISELDEFDEDTDMRTSLLSYGAQANWNKNDIGLEAEIVTGKISTSSGNDISRYAFTIMGTYTLFNKVTPYIRYEYLDPNTDADSDVANMLVYGINYQVTNGLYLKGEFDTVSSEDSNKRFKGINYTEFKFAVAIGF